MAKFKFAPLTHSPDVLDVISTCLGVPDDGAKFRSNTDIGKIVKLGDRGDNFVLAADGDNIEGFIDSIDAGGTENGMSFGGVARGRNSARHEAVIAAAQDEGETPAAAKVGDWVVAGDQKAAGETGTAVVRTGTPTGPFQWRILSMNGDGTAGTTVVLERA